MKHKQVSANPAMNETSAWALGTLEAGQLLASLLHARLNKNVDRDSDEIRKTRTHHFRISKDPDK